MGTSPYWAGRGFAPQASACSAGQLLTAAGESRRLWQVDHYCHCSLVGLGLSMAEQRKLMQREDIKGLSDYEVHAWLVTFCTSANEVAVRIERQLNVKHARHIRAVAGQSLAERRQYWKASLDSGEIAGAYWAIVSRWDTTAELQAQIFGDVHMLSHQNTGCLRNARHEIESLQQELRRLNERLKREAEQRRALQTENEGLRTASRPAANPAPSVEAPEAAGEQLATLRRKVEHQHQLIEELRQYRRDNQGLLKEVLELRARNEELDALATELAVRPVQPACSPACPAYATCARRVLLVGGITKMSAHYREVVSQAGCEFDHHDGYLRDGEKVLEGKISRCDMVICPVDVNSHNACLCVKKICKRLNKPYHMLPSSSLSSVARCLSA